MNENWEYVKEILYRNKEENDMLLQEIDQLHIILINLKIEDAHIQSQAHINTAITPIADHLDKTILDLQDKIKNIKHDRKKTIKIVKELDKIFK